MLRLKGRRRDVMLTCRYLLHRGRLGGGSTSSAVVTDIRRVVVDDGGVVNVGHIGDVHIRHRTVVVIDPASPLSAGEAHAGVAKAVNDTAIETHVRPPVARAPHVEAISPT